MRKQLVSLLCLLGLVACQQNEESGAASAPSVPNMPSEHVSAAAQDAPASDTSASQSISEATPQQVVARIKGLPVEQAMVDEAVKLKLYDLEWAKYELRRASLAQLVEQALQSGRVSGEEIEVLLEPPLPPRLDVDTKGQPHQGAAAAPVTLSIFCSYQSPHCARMQDSYQALQAHYGEQLRFVFYDFPQPFHRQGPEASFAARCAEEGGQFWPFHKALWAHQNDLGTALYERLASQLPLDQEAFAQCLKARKHLESVKANTEMAQAMGFGNVPVTLVNGLYLSGPKTTDTLRFFIDQELARLGTTTIPANVAGAETEIPASQLPLRLEGVILQGDPNRGTGKEGSIAMIRHLEMDDLRSYKQDQPVMENVFVVLVEADRVVIEHAGQLEFLPLQQQAPTGDGEYTAASGTAAAQQEQGARTPAAVQAEQDIPEEIRMAAESQGFKARPIVAPKGETPLSRAWLDQQLQRQTELADHFKPAELEVEGVHVLKLRGVEDNEFYQTLGLKEGDVVLRVNDEWVHEAHNNLFTSLENEQEVSVVLMRRGLPVHLKYAIN